MKGEHTTFLKHNRNGRFHPQFSTPREEESTDPSLLCASFCLNLLSAESARPKMRMD